MLTLISSCSINGRENKPVVVDTACTWVQPIYVTAQDVQVMDSDTKRAILSHNEKWDANCGSGKSRVN